MTSKSIIAVVAGFVAVLVLSIGTDTILTMYGIFPRQDDPGAYLPWMLIVALLYKCNFTILGGYITAALAPNRPMRHAMILGGIGFVIALLGAIINWDNATASGTWYPIALIILTLPSVWAGGKLKK